MTSDLKSFFEGVDLNEDTDLLLPVTPEEGAPPQNRYLFEMVGEKTKMIISKNGTVYVRFEAKVLEPVEFKNRRVWDNFYFSSPKAIQMTGQSLARIKGERFLKSVPRGDDNAAAYVAENLGGAKFVGVVKIEEDEGYAPKNRILRFLSADAWVPDAPARQSAIR